MLSRSALAAAAFAAAMAALVVAYLQVRRDNGAYRDELSELRSSMAQLRSELGGPRPAGTLQRLVPVRELEEAGAHDPAATSAATGAATGAREGDPAPAAADGAAGQPFSFDESFRLAEEQFRDEAIDAAWAGTTTSSVERVLAQLAPAGASVRGLSCHSTRCRLELNLRDEAQVESFQREALYGANVLWRGQMLMARDTLPDGSIAMVAHLMREPAI